MTGIKLSNIQTSVLISIGKFKFLTLSQMLKVGVGTINYKYLWKQVSTLSKRTRPLLKCVKFNTIDRVGRVEDIYYLSKYGYQFLSEINLTDISEILMPKREVLSAKDYHHRKTTLDFQIEVYNWCKIKRYELCLFTRYFDKKGNNRKDKNLRSITRIELKENRYIIPDAIFKLSNEGFERLFFFEFHVGKDSNRIFDQINIHLQTLISFRVHDKFLYPKNRAYFILILFSEDSTLQSLLCRISYHKDQFKHLHQYFLCKSLNTFNLSSFDESWTSILGYPFSLPIKSKSYECN